ncbi:MAG: hypothetical protein CV087_08965, partial [Candidatus Brocadia sp. WS118]
MVKLFLAEASLRYVYVQDFNYPPHNPPVYGGKQGGKVAEGLIQCIGISKFLLLPYTPLAPISVNLRIAIILSARYHSVQKGGNTMVEKKGVEHTDINKEDWEVLIS